VRGLWVGTAFAIWPAVSASLRHQPASARTAAAAGGWAIWTAVLVATFVPVPATLTAIRCAAPAVLAAVIAAAVTGQVAAIALPVGAAWSAAMTAAAFLPQTALWCVNGPAYANERRFPLAPPGPLLFGPLEVAWAVVVAAPPAGVLLLAAQQWVVGGLVTAIGVPLCALLARALHGLSRRWFVFVPAGVVVHDPMALADPVLFQRPEIVSLAPGREGLDLTLGAPGLSLQLQLRRDAELTVIRGRRREDVRATSVRIAPTTPGRVLAYAASHNFPVGAVQPAVPPPTTASPS